MSNLDLFSGKSNEEIAIERLQTFCPPEGYYLAFSGGKDSIVLMELAKRSGCKFDAHYNITGIDPPELYYFIRDNFPEVERHRPETTIWKLIEKTGFPPTRMIRYCCKFLKERGGVDRRVLTGVRWAESARRSKRKMAEACFKNSRIFYINPIIDWTDEDVWNYIKDNNLKYCSLYDEGWKRLGCIGCPMGSQQTKELERWPRYKANYLKAFQKGIDTHPGRSKIGKTSQAMYDWWIRGGNVKQDPDQTVMFE